MIGSLLLEKVAELLKMARFNEGYSYIAFG